MRSVCSTLTLLIAVSTLVPGCSGLRKSKVDLDYPEARKADVTDTYHGVEVADPYRWLEDPDSSESRAWIDAENELTFDYIGDVKARKRIKRRLTELWNYEKFSPPFKRGGRYFYFRNDGLQNQDVLYTTPDLAAKPKLLFDPNKLSEDGTVALSGLEVSEDGRYLAYSISKGGSDWQEWSVRDIETGEDLDDHIRWAKFTDAAWTPDSEGFFYSRYDEPPADNMLQSVNEFQKLYYHRLGTPQSADRLVYERSDHKDWGFSGEVTDDGAYLLISVWKGTERKNQVYYKKLESEGAPVVELIDRFEAQYSFIDNDGSVFWFKTDQDAPRGRIIAIDTQSPDRSQWKEIVPERAETLRGSNVVSNTFVASYLKDAHTQVRLYAMDGTEKDELVLPGIGSVSGLGGKRDESEMFYTYTSFTSPSTVYRYDFETDKSEVFRAPDVDFKPRKFVTRQVFFTSKDGTRVPMFITHKKGLRLNGKNPTYLYGYGGFNIALTPSFSPSNVVWMEMGGVYALANIRGGGEYGREWHEAGCKTNRQNVFDDFIAASEFLIDNNYTRSDRLAIAGGSNGGLLVAACMTQRPDLYGAVLPAVGVLDMLRFNKFTIGWAWESDYGSPEDAEQFEVLYGYSPLHNLKAGTSYPACLITTADHDDRVVPAHSFKFAAALQEAQDGKAPCLIRIDTKAGHGAGKPTEKRIDEAADKFAFLVRSLGMRVPWRL